MVHESLVVSPCDLLWGNGLSGPSLSGRKGWPQKEGARMQTFWGTLWSEAVYAGEAFLQTAHEAFYPPYNWLGVLCNWG